MSIFFRVIGGLFIIVCADLILSSFTENENFKKVISAGCFICSLYIILDFSYKYLLELMMRFLP